MKTLPLLFTSLVLALISFATPARAAAPSATTGTPSNITTNSATLNGSANPNGLATAAWFEWGTTTNYGTLTAGQSLGAGAAPVPVTANLSSLLTDTNYHARLVASNSAGLSYGADVIVTPTLLLYLYAGESWSYEFHDLPAGGQTSPNGIPVALGNFSILPGSFSAGSSVRWELFENSSNEPPFWNGVVNAPAASGSGGNTLSWADYQGAVRLTVLTGSVAVSSVSFTRINEHVGSFSQVYQNTITPTRNPPPPSFATQFVSSVTISSAVVSFDINVKNLPTLLSAQLGATTNYGAATGTLPDNFDYLVRRDIILTNLAPDTVYQTRIAATNSAGLAYGQNLTFKTLAPAVITTLPATQRTVSSATLNAQATVKGIAASAWFQWGTTTNYDQTTAPQDLGSASVTTNVAAPITGLSAQTAYHCRAVIVSAGVTNLGADLPFTTPPPPTNIVVTNLATDDVRGAIERGGSVVFACDGVLVLSNQIEIANDVVLDASGHSITFNGNNLTRIFSVTPGTTLRLTNIGFINGRATNSGGAIYNEGTVFAESCRFLNNAAVGMTGVTGTNGPAGTNSSSISMITPGIPGGPGGPGQHALGGGIFNSGSLTLSRCYFQSNSAAGGTGGTGGMGGDSGRWPLPPAPPSTGRNPADGGPGGAGGNALGGAIASFGHLVVSSCAFSNSSSLAGTGGRGGVGGLGGSAYIYRGNSWGGTGGEGQGGAVFISGTMFLSNSLLVGSSAQGGSGAPTTFNSPIFIFGSAGGAAAGGTFYNTSNSVVVNCTLVGSTARGGAGTVTPDTVPPGNGGHAFGGAIANHGSLTAKNLTLDTNSAIGGIASCYTSCATNGHSRGGSIASTGGVFQIVNSILSGGFSNNCFGTITDLGHNLSSDATPVWTSGTSVNSTNPLLLPLGNYGGPTLTMALHAGSPALDNADCALAPPTDQRGFPRPGGPGCDIGATEGASSPSLQVFRNTPAPHRLRWTALAGRTYHVESATSLSAWTPYATNVAVTNGVLELSVPVAAPERFFRLQAE